MKIELIPVRDIRDAPRNAKRHNVGMLVESFERFGVVEPGVRNECTGLCVAGHGRKKAVVAYKEKHGIAPVIRERDSDGSIVETSLEISGELCYPVITGIAFRSDSEAEAYLLASNAISEKGGYDNDMLRKIVIDHKENLSGTGFTDEDLETLIRASADQPNKAQPDDSAGHDFDVSIGQVWSIGNHTVACCDSALAVDLRSGTDSLFYDPPWDEFNKPDTSWDSSLVFTGGRRIYDAIGIFGPPTWVFVWDCNTCWYTPNRPLQRAKLCLWYGDLSGFDFDGAHADYGAQASQSVVTNSRGSYTYNPDPRGKHLADVYSYPIVSLHSGDASHKHSKPIDWIRLLIGDCTSGVVFDPFCGSGAAAVACEQLGRGSVSVDIDPHCVATTLDRLSGMGLGSPKLIGNM